MKFFQILPSLEKYGIQSLCRSKLCKLSCHFTLWNSQRSSGESKILIEQSKILNNVNSSMQSSAGKEIEIRAALSSDYGPSPNTGQSFFEKLGQNSDILRTNFEIPNTCSFSFVFGIFTKSTRSCSVLNTSGAISPFLRVLPTVENP